jgi:hypothetical protein
MYIEIKGGCTNGVIGKHNLSKNVLSCHMPSDIQVKKMPINNKVRKL